MTTVIVEAQDLEKYFFVDRPLYRQLLIPFAARQKIWALKGVSFRINPGEILGVVGPNGAGKTTLLRILADLLESTSGLVTLCGQSLNSKKCCLRGKIGYVPSDDRSFFWRLTGRQNLEFFASIYGVRRSDAHRRIAAMLSAFALTQKANQLFRDYSTGTRKKFALIRALVHQPTIILLDELTNSLDLESVEAVKSLMRKYVSSRNGCAAVWSTHRLEEIAEVCDKVLILNQGEVKFFGPVSDVETKFVRNVYSSSAILRVKPVDGVIRCLLVQCGCGV